MPRVKLTAAKNEPRERNIERALVERAEKGASFVDLSQSMVFQRVPSATAVEACRPARNHTKPTKHLPQRWRKCLVGGRYKWIHKAFRQDRIYSKLWQKISQEEGWGSLGPAWLRGCLNRHSAVPARFASTMDRQRAFANAPGPIEDYFQKLRDNIIYCKIKKENMRNMGEKGFTLDTANHAKVIAFAGRHPPQAIHDGTHDVTPGTLVYTLDHSCSWSLEGTNLRSNHEGATPSAATPPASAGGAAAVDTKCPPLAERNHPKATTILQSPNGSNIN